MLQKFRAWIKKENRMGEVGALVLCSLRKAALVEGHGSYLLKDLELMQYTGLKDKNGKEIYEGDIIKLNVNNGFDYLKDGKALVTDSKLQVGLVCKIDEMEYRLFKSPNLGYEYEVIGNRYENPELV